MKIKISDLEKKLPYKLKRNFKSIGLDGAMIYGIAILTTNKEYLHIEPLVLSFRTKNKKEVYYTIVKTLEKMIESDHFAIIEDVFSGYSRGGSIELAKFPAFAISECIKKDIPYETMLATTARSKFKINTRKYGKGKSKLAVRDWIKSLGLKMDDSNLADAFVLGLVGICDKIDYRSEAEIKRSKKKSKRKKAQKRK